MDCGEEIMATMPDKLTGKDIWAPGRYTLLNQQLTPQNQEQSQPIN